MNLPIIFCTACVDTDPSRWQDWLDYYSQWPCDLLLVNDGPISTPLNLHKAQVIQFDQRLGIIHPHFFPGWSRSFFTALAWCRCRYREIGHIESDFYVTDAGKAEFFKYLGMRGYCTGWCPRYEFPEVGLQILNDPHVLDCLLNYYRPQQRNSVASVEENVKALKPHYILQGDRYEGCPQRWQPHYNYMGQIDLKTFRQLFAATTPVPFSSVTRQ